MERTAEAPDQKQKGTKSENTTDSVKSRYLLVRSRYVYKVLVVRMSTIKPNQTHGGTGTPFYGYY